MGIIDILKGAGGGSPDIPQGGGYSKSDVNLANQMAKRMSEIEKLVKSSNKSWEKMSATRSLQKAQKSLAAFAKQQNGFNKAMKSGNINMSERIKQYSKLADARNEAIKDTKEYNKQLNESKGAMGRMKNVLDEMPTGMSIFAAAARDLGIVLGDMSQGFDIMARTGQVQGQTMGELASATGNYMVQMRMGSVVAARFGVTAEDSNAAFAKLTETYGGTGEAVDEMAKKWGGMAAMAKLSGLGMVDIANMADQGFKKLGETLDDTLNTVTAMTEITGDLNNRFGKGAVNSKAFAAAIQDMAYGASFMNQNSRMLTETLGRELQMQLALGKAPEAALKSAQKNMEMAGKVNIVGITQFRDGMQAEYDAMKKQGKGEEHLKKLADDLGSEGEIIANMLSSGTLQSSDNLFAFEKAVQNSSALSSMMLDSMRASAAGGDVGQLLAKGLSIQDAQYMVAEADLLQAKIVKLQKGGDAEAAAMFGDNWQEDEEAVKFVEKSRKKGARSGELSRDFYKMGGAGKTEAARKLAAEAAGDTQEPWEKFVSANDAAGWMVGMLNATKTIPELLNSLPLSLGAVIGAIMTRGVLGKLLKNLPLPGMSKGPSYGGTGMGGGMKGMGGMKGIAKMMGKAGLVGLAISAVAGFGMGMAQASEIFQGIDVGAAEYAAAGIGGAVNMLTMGLIDTADAAHTAMDLGGWVKSGFGFNDPLAKTDSDSELDMDAVAKQRAFLRERGKLPAASNAKNATSDTSGKSGGDDVSSGGAQATGSLSGSSLILEVSNWDSIYAQSVLEASR